MYDQFGEEGLSGAGMAGGMDAEDLFSQLFGFGGGRARTGPRRGRDIVHRLKVKLKDLYLGKTSRLAVQKNVICSNCNGKGGMKEDAVRQCDKCKGAGFTVTMRQMGPMVQQVQQPCSQCHGQGEIIDEKEKCPVCNGGKVVSERKILEVHVDKGMRDGQRITFAGEADQAPGIEPGDIIIVLNQQPDEHFQRKGNDLIHEAHIDLLSALAGGQFAIPHLDDRILLVKIEPGEAIKPGSVKVIPREGMPTYRHHDHGDLYIKFAVNFPEPRWTDEANIAKLETILPPRPQLPSFGDKHVENVSMKDADKEQAARATSSGGARGYMDMDEEEEESAGPGVQCAQQ